MAGFPEGGHQVWRRPIQRLQEPERCLAGAVGGDLQDRQWETEERGRSISHPITFVARVLVTSLLNSSSACRIAIRYMDRFATRQSLLTSSGLTEARTALGPTIWLEPPRG